MNSTGIGAWSADEHSRARGRARLHRRATTVRRVTIPFDPSVPDYAGGSLINLVAELEWRLTGSAPAPRLHATVADSIPAAATYILFLIDGLGAHQLDHPAARPLAASHRSTIHAPFPTTTTVSLACVATGLPPARHGFIGHFVLLSGHPLPVNGLRWIDTTGRGVPSFAPRLLPAPNLWERLCSAGTEAITVQSADFAGSALTKALYRGCRFEGVAGTDEMVRATVELARIPGRLVFVYHHLVDVAAHMQGPSSRAYANALADASGAWDRIAARLPTHVAMVGTADHGVVPIPESGKLRLRSQETPGLTMFGDPRSLYVSGPRERIRELSTRLPAVWHPRETLERLWGADDDRGEVVQPTPVRRPSGAFLADRGRVLLPGHMDKRLVGYHGGLDPAEVDIPVLVPG